MEEDCLPASSYARGVCRPLHASDVDETMNKKGLGLRASEALRHRGPTVVRSRALKEYTCQRLRCRFQSFDSEGWALPFLFLGFRFSWLLVLGAPGLLGQRPRLFVAADLYGCFYQLGSFLWVSLSGLSYKLYHLGSILRPLIFWELPCVMWVGGGGEFQEQDRETTSSWSTPRLQKILQAQWSLKLADAPNREPQFVHPHLHGTALLAVQRPGCVGQSRTIQRLSRWDTTCCGSKSYTRPSTPTPRSSVLGFMAPSVLFIRQSTPLHLSM